MQFFASSTAPESDAAAITHEFGSVTKTGVELVSADREAMANREVIDPEDFEVTSVNGGDVGTQGVNEYVNCILFCTGANCAGPAARCRLIPYLPAVLACMAAVCGSKVRTCHRVCKRYW